MIFETVFLFVIMLLGKPIHSVRYPQYSQAPKHFFLKKKDCVPLMFWHLCITLLKGMASVAF